MSEPENVTLFVRHPHAADFSTELTRGPIDQIRKLMQDPLFERTHLWVKRANGDVNYSLDPPATAVLWSCAQETGREYRLDEGPIASMRVAMQRQFDLNRDVWLILEDGTKELPRGFLKDMPGSGLRIDNIEEFVESVFSSEDDDDVRLSNQDARCQLREHLYNQGP